MKLESATRILSIAASSFLKLVEYQVWNSQNRKSKDFHRRTIELARGWWWSWKRAKPTMKVAMVDFTLERTETFLLSWRTVFALCNLQHAINVDKTIEADSILSFIDENWENPLRKVLRFTFNVQHHRLAWLCIVHSSWLIFMSWLCRVAMFTRKMCQSSVVWPLTKNESPFAVAYLTSGLVCDATNNPLYAFYPDFEFHYWWMSRNNINVMTQKSINCHHCCHTDVTFLLNSWKVHYSWCSHNWVELFFFLQQAGQLLLLWTPLNAATWKRRKEQMFHTFEQ